MSALCLNENHTYATLDYNVDHIITVKGKNRIIGALGDCKK